jgi:hypothetical protein
MRTSVLVAITAAVLAMTAAPAVASRITVEPSGESTFSGTLALETGLGLIRVVCHKEELTTFNRGTIEGSLVLNGNSAGTLRNLRLSECRGGEMDTSLNREVPLSYVRITETEWQLTALGFRILFSSGGLRCLLTILMVIRSVGSSHEFELWELSLGSILALAQLSGSGMCPNEWILEGRLPLGGRWFVRLTV